MKKNVSDISEVEDVIAIVDRFYSQALEDTTIGAFFTEAVPLQLDEHMPRIVSFWSSILFGTNDYKENVMLKHIKLHHTMSIEERHMHRWLELWQTTVDALFIGPRANLAKTRAQQIGLLMLTKIKATERLDL